MNEPSFPVTVAVKRPDGSTEQVRVGTAVRVDDSFQLSLGELSIGGTADPARPAARPSRPAGGAGGGMLFPNYGRSKGTPVAGASIGDLEFYMGGCRRTLNDPNKSQWHDKERVLLAAIEAELANQGEGSPAAAPGAFLCVRPTFGYFRIGGTCDGAVRPARDGGEHVGVRQRAGVARALERKLLAIDAARGIDGENQLEIDSLSANRARQHGDAAERYQSSPDHPGCSPNP